MRAIRDLTHQLNEYCSNGTTLGSESMPQLRQQSNYDEKLERCCQRLEQLTNKVDRLISLEQTGNFYRIFIKKILFSSIKVFSLDRIDRVLVQLQLMLRLQTNLK